MAMARARQDEAEGRGSQQIDSEQQQAQGERYMSEVRRKTAKLLRRLEELGAPDAVIVSAIDTSSGRLSGGEEQAAWLIHSSNLDWSELSEHYLLADGRFAQRRAGSRSQLPRICYLFTPRLGDGVLSDIERLIGKYS